MQQKALSADSVSYTHLDVYKRQPFGIIDLSLAPTPAIGDSIAEIFQEMGLQEAGAPGTTAALAMLNDNVKKGGVMASSYVGGLSGAFIPVIGKGVGGTVEFGGLLGYAPIMPVNSYSCKAFIDRGGRIPAPIHSFKN